MARNGSGTYARAVSAYVYGTIISQTDVNTEMDDIATALTNSLAKNGETTPTANLPMGGFKLTGLAAGAANGDSLRYEQVIGVYALLSGATLTGPYLFPAGSAAAPSVSASGDSNTGRYFPSVDTIGDATGGTQRTQIDSTGFSVVSGGCLVKDPAALLGYGTGAGGSVTQTTSKSTGVPLNKPCGQITMHNASLAAGAEVGFTLTNSLVSSTSIVNIHPTSSFSGYSLRWFVDTGAVGIYVKNETGAPLSEAVKLNFSVNAVSTA